ncbi:protein virilizer isoform X2 [Chironomus tepperi]|uniref:protein virilizer isoform X2 n=1 Tax=Chironomus tepperi TaxID=113505 RepID=UPI00391EFC40
MVENSEESNREELIFFDTFSHDLHEKLNLDLVQFRQNPVYISEIRIIPLGARVQADFPGGGNRLGATNPSQFDIEFFVNDLSVNVASTFERLGKFSYNQNECINFKCKDDMRRIPTDGLVLKGYYTTITLAVYGNVISYGSMQKIVGSNNVEGSAVQISSNDETNESENGEIYNTNNHHNDFQDQNSSCDPTVSSTIADDLKEDDQPNLSPADIYSRSPSKEQDLIKTKRDWSTSDSPEESFQHSKRLRYDRRKPRSPPLQSPRISRPESDDELKKNNHSLDNDYVDQSTHLSTTFCPLSPSLVNNNTPIESPTEMEDVEPIELEPILSDDDIMDEVNGLDDFTDEMYIEEFSIKMFNPFTDNLRKADQKPHDKCKVDKLRDQLHKMTETYNKAFSHRESLNESWLTFCEQLIHCLHSSSEQIEIFTQTIDVNVMNVILSCIKIGLSYSESTKYHQAGCNLRHLKAGIRLVECFANNSTVFKWIIQDQKYNLFKNLFDLFPCQLVPMPVKLLVARVVHKLIDTSDGINEFIEFDGYKNIVTMLSSIIDIRLLYTLKQILKKMHVYETLQSIKNLSIEIFRKCKRTEQCCDYEQIIELENLFAALIVSHKQDILQTRKFVPIASQFEIPSKVKSPDFVSFYKIHSFMETLVLLLNVKNFISSKLTFLVFNYVRLMLDNTKEFNYLSDNIDMSNDLVKMLLESTNNETSNDTTPGTTTNSSDETLKNLNIDIGLEIAYKMETKYLMDSISHLTDEIDIAEKLDSLYYLCVGIGKKHVLDYVAMDDNLCVFLNLIDREKKISAAHGSPGFKHKSPVLSYCIDIVDFVVRNVENLDYLRKYEGVLMNLVKHHDSFEPSVAAMLQEMSVFLKPLEVDKLFNYDDLSPLIEIIKRNLEYLTNFPGDLIMTLRILKYLIAVDNKSDYRELKSDYYAILLYHNDGLLTLLSVLEKISTHFDQPMIHAYLFGANQGALMMKIVHPTVQILRKMLVQVIESRNVNFKDITAIETLLKTYTLMHSINSRCSIYKDAKEVQNEIIKILLSYTQSLSPDVMNTTNIHKSLWTQMFGEIIKYTLNGPHRFISGLTILSELLPLPLPIPIQSNEINKLEAQRLITERQLWSAHLHPQSQLIMEMIQTFCISCSTDLLSILYSVCVQLSDLAPNMTLLVARSVVDMILAEAAERNNEGSVTLSRLLKFLALLVRHACVKVSVLSILSGKLAEVLSHLLRISNDGNNDHVLSQFYVYMLLQYLFDSEISMLTGSDHNPELILASGLPFKEHIAQFVDDIVDNFTKTRAENLTYSSLRIMTLLTERDVTFKFLKNALTSKDEKVVERLNSIAEKCKNDRKYMQVIPDIMDLLRSLVNIETNEMSTLPPRTISLSYNELSNVLKWNSDEYRNGNKIHFLQVFKALVNEPKVEKEDDDTRDLVNGVLTNVKVDLDLLLDQLRETSKNTLDVVVSSDDDISLLQAEGIVTQFSSRIPYFVSDNIEEITMDYWMLNACSPTEDEELQINDQVKFDMDEFIRECLPTETDIKSDCKRLLALSSSPQSNRDKNQPSLCFRTRRIEVATSETIPGRPEKKIFNKFPTRGRGFSRVAIRGDIFRSRPPNTSRPPSLHVDDFVAMESGGQSSYNKREILTNPRSRGRASFIRGGRGSTSFSPRGHNTYPRTFRGGRPIRRGRGFPR